MYLCGTTVPERNEEMMVVDNWKMAPQIWNYLRDINMLNISALSWGVFLLGNGIGEFEESPRVNQVWWGFESTACGPISL